MLFPLFLALMRTPPVTSQHYGFINSHDAMCPVVDHASSLPRRRLLFGIGDRHRKDTTSPFNLHLRKDTTSSSKGNSLVHSIKPTGSLPVLNGHHSLTTSFGHVLHCEAALRHGDENDSMGPEHARHCRKIVDLGEAEMEGASSISADLCDVMVPRGIRWGRPVDTFAYLEPGSLEAYEQVAFISNAPLKSDIAFSKYEANKLLSIPEHELVKTMQAVEMTKRVEMDNATEAEIFHVEGYYTPSQAKRYGIALHCARQLRQPEEEEQFVD